MKRVLTPIKAHINGIWVQLRAEKWPPRTNDFVQTFPKNILTTLQRALKRTFAWVQEFQST